MVGNVRVWEVLYYNIQVIRIPKMWEMLFTNQYKRDDIGFLTIQWSGVVAMAMVPYSQQSQHSQHSQREPRELLAMKIWGDGGMVKNPWGFQRRNHERNPWHKTGFNTWPRIIYPESPWLFFGKFWGMEISGKWGFESFFTTSPPQPKSGRKFESPHLRFPDETSRVCHVNSIIINNHR